jgi:hypothetical protein
MFEPDDSDPHRIPPDGCVLLCFFAVLLVAFVVGVVRSLLLYFYP